MPEHLDQAQHGTDDADGGRVTTHVREQLRGGFVRGPLGVDLGAEDDRNLFGVCAVDSQLQAATQEVVVDISEFGLQRQQAFPACLGGQPDQCLDRTVRVRRLGFEGPDQFLGQRLRIAQHATGDGGADGATEDQQHRGGQEDAGNAAAFHRHRSDDCDNRENDADKQRRVHQESVRRNGTTGWPGETAADSTRTRGIACG